MLPRCVLEIPGWSFISDFANRGKGDGKTDEEVFVSRKIPIDKRFLKDIIAQSGAAGQMPGAEVAGDDDDDDVPPLVDGNFESAAK